MKIHIEMKPEQPVRHLGTDANAWPNDGTWRVTAAPPEHVSSDDFEVNDLLLMMSTQYRGYAVINLTKSRVYTREINNGRYVQIKRDFTVRQVQLYFDGEDKP